VVKVEMGNSSLNDDRTMRRLFSRLLGESRGQDLVEYALLLVLLALLAIAGVAKLSKEISKPFNLAAECNAKPQAEQARACQDTGPRDPQNGR
jgi:Flp pilus assembly pilin Flp